MDHNGYFLLENKNGATYISQVKAEGSGHDATIEELVSYLEKKKISSVDVSTLKTIVEQTAEGESVRLLASETIPFAGWCEYTTAPNAMYAQLTMYPPMKGMPDATTAEVEKDIAAKGIVYGINKDLIKVILGSHRYFEPFVFAKGKAPREGSDAVLTYNFNTEIDMTPTILENGMVDFHHLDNINHVKAGDVVATITPEDVGESGINILGQEVKPRKVLRKSFKYSRNLHVSPDGTQLITDVTGHVSLEIEKVFVSDQYEVKVDVDNSTGDIDYDGNVRVRGAVRSGFKVHATGSIIVDGVVEAAELIAGKDIILGRGVSGQGRAVLTAEGNVISTFIESANVTAGDRIEADTIIQSNVYAKNVIEAKGRSGNIIGGVVRAGSVIIAKEIGSKMGTNTVISMGSGNDSYNELKTIKAKIDKATEDRNKMTQLVEALKKKLAVSGTLDPEKLVLLQNATKNMLILSQSINNDTALYEKISSEIHDPKDARIKVSRSIYSGVKLEFGKDVLFIRDQSDHCQYVKRGADIVMIAL